ncbi:hypothetical protein BJX62DRAFT_148850 [Aspergillus germanicus]
MSGFLDLPVELWDQILPHADIPGTRVSKLDSDPYERFDLRQLSHLSRVNRKWYQALLPYLYTTWSYDGAHHSYMSLWKLSNVWPALYLSSLRSVYLHDLDTEGLASFFEMQNDNSTRICHVQHLYVATHDDSKCLPEDVHALLTLPKALVTLSFSWLNYKFKFGSRRRFTRKISNHQIWSALQQLADSLESLNLVHRINKSHHFTKDHFDSLRIHLSS